MNGKLNRYTCQACGFSIVTIDREEGVTPMFLSCRRPDPCPGRMVSQMYRGVISEEPTHEWRRPPRRERRKMSREMQEHFHMGGLDLREIGKESA